MRKKLFVSVAIVLLFLLVTLQAAQVTKANPAPVINYPESPSRDQPAIVLGTPQIGKLSNLENARAIISFSVQEPASWFKSGQIFGELRMIRYIVDGEKFDVPFSSFYHNNSEPRTYTKLTSELSEGTHSFQVYVSSVSYYHDPKAPKSGVMYDWWATPPLYYYMEKYSHTVYFTVDTTPPCISGISQENTAFNSTEVPLTFNVNETSALSYSLDNHANITISGNTTVTGLPSGSHQIVVYAKDAVGNTGKSDNFVFIVKNPSFLGFDGWINFGFILFAAIGAVIASLFSLIYYWRTKKNKPILPKGTGSEINKKKTVIALLIIAIIIVGSFAAAEFYNSSKISLQKNEAANSNSQDSNFKAALENLMSPKFETSLGAAEIPGNFTYNSPTPQLYNHLYISGSVVNVGEDSAFNAGLNVEAFFNDGSSAFNMTVPVGEGLPQIFGTDNATRIYGDTPLQFGSMFSGESVAVKIAIYHEGVVSDWVITPVWRNPAIPK